MKEEFEVLEYQGFVGSAEYDEYEEHLDKAYLGEE